jgi:hypothetical protein
MLGTSEAAELAAGRYRRLAWLVDEAASESSSTQDRDIKSLKNYARWVLLSLRMLAENETVPPFSEGAPPYPGARDGGRHACVAARPDPGPLGRSRGRRARAVRRFPCRQRRGVSQPGRQLRLEHVTAAQGVLTVLDAVPRWERQALSQVLTAPPVSLNP